MTQPDLRDDVTSVETPADVDRDRLIAYYENAAPDYGEWSRGFNMHFGFYRRGVNRFRRETMLEEMNRQVRRP